MSIRKRNRLRGKLLQADPFCSYCGIGLVWETSSLDHVVPRSRGGTNALCNLALCCRECNTAKAAMTPMELLRWANRIVAIAEGGTRVPPPPGVHTRVHAVTGRIKPQPQREQYQ